MSTRIRLWLVTLLTGVLFLCGVLVTRALVRPVGASAWLLLGGLSLLGITATAVVLVFLARRWKDRIRREKIAAREDQIAHAFMAARKRLGASGRASSPRIGKLPLVLVVGPQGSTKTTAVVRSGLEPDLLAGEVHQGDAVIPTETVNLWFAEGTVFLEVGGRALEQEDRWEAILDHAQPDRMAAAFGRGGQAPRAAVVCVACDELLRPGASEAIPGLARKIRERLVRASQALGIRLPVYVLFTRADRLPYFDDYVRSLSREETREALGASLPVDDPSRHGPYAEIQARRVGAAMDGILGNLALNRREVLRRESEPTIKAGAYEFPRELGKASGLIQRFLIDLCRPSQLEVSPFLRGFYFTGVRAIVVNDPGAAHATEAPGTPASAMGATAVFDPSKLRQETQAPAAPSGRSRRIPDWAFLEPVFRDVLLADRSARAVTTGGSRVDFLRRALLTAAILVGILATGGFTVSFFKNRALARDVTTASALTRTAGATVSPIPALEDLVALEELRVEADSLWTWEAAGAPWSLRWGLYSGDDLLPHALRVYLSGFERVLGGSAREALVASLGTRPAEGGAASDYEATYRSLKAYLITTSHPQYSTPDFLTPELLEHWEGARALDPERSTLLRAQLDFFGEIIAAGHPFAPRPDDAVIARTRVYLAQFAEGDRFYQSMLADAGTRGTAVNFSARFPGTESVIRNEHVVPASFTREARQFVIQADVDEFFSSEDWVMGGDVVPPQDRAALADELRTRYAQDYMDHWQRFLASAQVVAYGGAGDAAIKLGRLSDPQSPLLAMLAVVAEHTAVQDSSQVRTAFRSVHAVSPPDSVDTYVGEWNQSYVLALGSLRNAMDQVATVPPASRVSALGQAGQAANQAEGAVRTLAQGFGIDPEGQVVRTSLTTLLLQPVRRAEALVGALPAADMNQKGQTFCGDFGRLLQGFPFQPSGQASVDDVTAALKPGESALWTFHQDVLAGLLARQGARYEARVGAEPTPRREFVEFFNRAAAVSEALFDASGRGPQIAFTLRPQIPTGFSAITVNVDGQPKRFTPTDLASPTFVWEGQRAQYARITGTVDGVDQPLLDFNGSPWSIFRLFQQARWEEVGRSRYMVHWTLPGRGTTLSAEVGLTTPYPILDPAFLAGVAGCVSRIAG